MINTVQGVDLPALNALLLDVHRAGCEAPFKSFKALVLREIQPLIPFDAGWWGTATADPPGMHHLHSHHCGDDLSAAYLPWMARDCFRAALIERPGVAINLADITTRSKLVRSALYQHFCKPFRIEWTLGVVLVEPVSSLYEFLTVWRHDPRRPFSEGERETLELLMPHLAQAYRVARERSVVGLRHKQDGAWAITDDLGYLREVSPGFVHALRARWPAWRGTELPCEVRSSVIEGQTYGYERLRIEVRVSGNFRYLEIARPGPVDRLSPREREVAQRYAHGETYVDIAQALAISPVTVRNHLAKCFRKLAVSNKIELAKALLQPGKGG